MSATIPPSLIHRLQLDVAARLDAALTHVHVTAVNPLDAGEAVRVQTQIDNQLAGLVTKNDKSGMAALVLVPEMGAADDNLPGPQMTAEVTVRIIEQPMVNRGAAGTQLTPEEVALKVHSLLHHWAPAPGMLLRSMERQALSQVEVKDKIAWDAKFTTAFPVLPEARLSGPSISAAANVLTLTGPSGSAVYYTLDGTLPTVLTGVLYTAPFTPDVEGEYTLRAVAVRSGYQDSSVLTAELEGVVP